LVTGTVTDLRHAVNYLFAQPICRQNIAYGGVSLGGVIGVQLAAVDSRIRVLVLASVPGTLRAAITSPAIVAGGEVLPGLSRDPVKLAAAVRILAPLDPARAIGRIAPRPVMILSGREDTAVSFSSALELQRAARAPKTIVDYNGGHEPFGANGAPSQSNTQAVIQFLLRYLVEPTYGL
jgi:fermentation-respiration switch protein FrsA (DUF1100 family)